MIMYKLQKYDILLQANEFLKWIEDMANEGWFIQDIHEESNILKFKKDTPKKLHYILYHHDYKKSPSEDFLEAAQEQGWELVGEEILSKQIFLFKSELEDPIPLETDPEEIRIKIKQSINRSLLNFLIYLFIISLWVIRIFSPNASQNDAFIFVALYSLMAFRLLIALLRRSFVNKPESKWIGAASKFFVNVNHALPFVVVIFMLLIAYRHTHSVMVKTMIVPDSFVTVSELEDYGTSVQNELMSASQFSFDPSYTYFFQIPQEDGYTISLYQTRQTVSKNDLLKVFKDASVKAQWAWFSNGPLLTILEETPESTTYWQAENSLEYLTLFIDGNMIYTLHTINLDLNQHRSVLERMGD